MANKSVGLTQAGVARVNQSVKASVYGILGSQFNVRSSILGSSGSAKEAQREFLVLVEDVIRKPDISKSIQPHQAPGLCPQNLLLNIQTTVGYNSRLKNASS